MSGTGVEILEPHIMSGHVGNGTLDQDWGKCLTLRDSRDSAGLEKWKACEVGLTNGCPQWRGKPKKHFGALDVVYSHRRSLQAWFMITFFAPFRFCNVKRMGKEAKAW